VDGVDYEIVAVMVHISEVFAFGKSGQLRSIVQADIDQALRAGRAQPYCRSRVLAAGFRPGPGLCVSFSIMAASEVDDAFRGGIRLAWMALVLSDEFQ